MLISSQRHESTSRAASATSSAGLRGGGVPAGLQENRLPGLQLDPPPEFGGGGGSEAASNKRWGLAEFPSPALRSSPPSTRRNSPLDSGRDARDGNL